MPLRLFLPLAVLLLAACSSPEEVAEKTGVERTQTANASATSSAGATGAAIAVSEDTDLYSYAFAYPANVGAHPALAARLRSEADREKAALIAAARDGQADAKADGYPFNPYGWRKEWKVVADLPDYLSLSGEFSTYSGGAHGMYGVESLVWDKQAERKLDGADLFVSPDVLDAALQPALCDALDAEREERRGEPVGAPTDDYGFNSCQHVADSTVLVGSSNGKTFDRLTIYFGPYVAGPYAEGAYELDLPVDRRVIAAVKPEYRAAFSARR